MPLVQADRVRKAHRRPGGHDRGHGGARRRACTRCRRPSSTSGAIQCGFCTPGMIMNAYALLLARSRAGQGGDPQGDEGQPRAAAPATSRSSTRWSWPPRVIREQGPVARRRRPPRQAQADSLAYRRCGPGRRCGRERRRRTAVKTAGRARTHVDTLGLVDEDRLDVVERFGERHAVFRARARTASSTGRRRLWTTS
ncbi:MAG: 2Fe-2S iron-sulfur cluster-binding protein [Marinilabiliales bacterium]|nr:2Fe-2S iron-sulfur cluster-binding protein [Marinilabiliales bacterium]